ncbi:MAG: C40 family peptidase [Clostridia bacterium]|nr:C40 family peptidase [Clostridia bacterium]
MNKLIKVLSPVILVIAIMFVVPVSASAVSGSEIVNYARQYIGCAYVRNTHGPTTFDCSGFVYYVFSHFGIEMSLSSNEYFTNPGKFGTVVGTGSTANAKAGDLISWSGHVAIYTENGNCVEALNARYGVTESIAVNKHTNGMNYKVIRVYGVNDGAADKEAPVISNAKASDITFTSFKVNCTLKDNVSVSKVVIDVKGPKTAKSFTVNAPAANFSYTVDASAIDGAGKYSVTITAYDDAGNQASAEISSITIAPHTHKYTSKVTKEATCTQEGVKTFTCSCGASYTESIPVTAHTPGSWVITKEPTTSKTGERTLYCSVCNQPIKKETLPKVSSSNQYVYSISISDFSMYYKNKYQIKPVVTADKNAVYSIAYSSSDPKIAKVDSDGNVTALKRGNATITATAIDLKGNVVKDTCKVTVKFTVAQSIIWLFALGFLWY